MKKHLTRGAILFLMSTAFAQAMLSAPRPAYAQAVSVYSQGQLQQLVAPIALYADPLLGEVLMASTYPLEVAEAGQWRNVNPGISGDYLVSALAQQPWAPSVKGLTEFPQVLQMMNNNLDWTEKLGEAFLANQAGVMDAVQQLRRQAQASGMLVSGPQQTVLMQDGYIAIAPADPAQVYVPYYNPVTVFAPWPYPEYMPYTFVAPNGVVYVSGVFGYFTGILVVDALWDWDTWEWREHRIRLDDRRWRNLDNGQPPPEHGAWQFEPEHRHNVPYKDETVRTRFENAAPETLRPYRGYEEGAAAPAREVSAVAPAREARQPEIKQPEMRQPEMRQPEIRQAEARQPETRAPEEAPRAAPPLFESFAPGPVVRTEAERGSFSMHDAPSAKAPPPVVNNPPHELPQGSLKDNRQ